MRSPDVWTESEVVISLVHVLVVMMVGMMMVGVMCSTHSTWYKGPSIWMRPLETILRPSDPSEACSPLKWVVRSGGLF